MANINDGGNFSSDLFTRLKAMKNGSMSIADLDASDKIPQDAINTASGVLGTVQGPNIAALSKLAGLAQPAEQAATGMAKNIAGDAVDESIPLWKRIQNAKGTSGSSVSVVPTAEQAANDSINNQYANSPKNFFDNAAQTAEQKGVSASPLEQQQFQTQKNVTQDMIRNRYQQQLQNAKDPTFQKLKMMLSGGQ